MSVSVTESVNIEVLKGRFPTELINPFGEVVVVPSKHFQRGWESSLESQGHRVFVGDYDGEAAFLVRIDKSKPRNVEGKLALSLESTRADASANSDAQAEASSSKAGGRHWTLEETQKLKEMLEQNVNVEEIAKALGRTVNSVERKIHRLKMKPVGSEPIPQPDLNPAISEDVVKELLMAASELYPRFRHACRVILDEASKLLGGE